VTQSPNPGTVTLDGVQIDYFYLGGTPPIFGPNQQQSCANCPLVLTGGTVFTMGLVLVQVFPTDSTTLFWFNASSLIPFEEWECSWSGTTRPAGWPAQGCPFTTQWNQVPTTVYTSGGGSLWISYPLTLSIPDPAPDLPGGFDVQMVFTVLSVPGGSFSGG
jgi:hypothetical protein